MPKLASASIAVVVGMCALLFALMYVGLQKIPLPQPYYTIACICLAFAVVGIQFVISPLVIDWVVQKRWANPSEVSPEFAEWLGKTCAQIRIPVPKFGIIEDGSPSAFTYGNVPGNARVVVTRGVMDMLSPAEFRAVVAHELGHVRNRDFIVMTFVQALVLTTNLLARSQRSRRSDIYTFTFGIVAYYVSYYLSLLLSRIREYMADEASAQITQNPNDLSRALVKICYGLATSHAVNPGYLGSSAPAQQPPVATANFNTMAPPAIGRQALTPIVQGAPKVPTAVPPRGAMTPQEIFDNLKQSQAPRPVFGGLAGLFVQPATQTAGAPQQKKKEKFDTLKGMGALGIAGVGSVRSAVAWMGQAGTIDPQNFVVASRWEFYNPWARLAELVSTHPLPALRIKALQQLCRRFNQPQEFDFKAVLPAKYKSFLRDLVVVGLPVAFAAAGAAVGYWSRGGGAMGAVAGVCLGLGSGSFFQAIATYPFGSNQRKVLQLIGEVDVSHVNPIPVVVEGTLTGRKDPGLMWASDYILQDETGFITVVNRMPLMSSAIWGFLYGRNFVGSKVRVHGWYRRFQAPYIEVERIEVAGGFASIRTYVKVARFIFPVLLVLIGAALLLVRF